MLAVLVFLGLQIRLRRFDSDPSLHFISKKNNLRLRGVIRASNRDVKASIASPQGHGQKVILILRPFDQSPYRTVGLGGRRQDLTAAGHCQCNL